MKVEVLNDKQGEYKVTLTPIEESNLRNKHRRWPIFMILEGVLAMYIEIERRPFAVFSDDHESMSMVCAR